MEQKKQIEDLQAQLEAAKAEIAQLVEQQEELAKKAESANSNVSYYKDLYYKEIRRSEALARAIAAVGEYIAI